MKESGYYPPGAEHDPNAPYNQVDTPEKEFDVSISQSLSKATTITTRDYILQVDEDEGYECADTSNTNWVKAYEDTAMTPIDIICACSKLAQHLLNTGVTYLDGLYLRKVVEECNGWCADETDVEPD